MRATANNPKNIQFRVIIPANVKPGQMLRIRCPDGTEGDVRVPKGLKPGNSFIFEMPAEALLNKGLTASQQQQQQQQTTGSHNHQTTTEKSSFGNRKQDSGSGGSSSLYSNNSSNNNNKLSHHRQTNQSGGFLDREIVDKEDFLTALAVGVLIGLSIVAGFLVGVIISTEP